MKNKGANEVNGGNTLRGKCANSRACVLWDANKAVDDLQRGGARGEGSTSSKKSHSSAL